MPYVFTQIRPLHIQHKIFKPLSSKRLDTSKIDVHVQKINIYIYFVSQHIQFLNITSKKDAFTQSGSKLCKPHYTAAGMVGF